MTLIERLRNPMDGWTGDASCVSAEDAAEAADRIEALEAALRPFATYEVAAIATVEGVGYRVSVTTTVQPEFRHFQAARDLLQGEKQQ